ncbi:MAG TPA: hypothetical protein VII92_10225, partial [Anaerolineae bacterium]
WLREHPTDPAGVPFYSPLGRTKTFDDNDLERIRAQAMEDERCRLELLRQEEEEARSTPSEGRSPEGLLMRLQRRETKRLLNNLRLVSK